tara:strand:- start:245 stop:637 length:393 start_codon:yes stop_codon:yes gene_type:complete
MAADILHHGHINILLKSNKYGNIVVGLMTDKGIIKYKKKKPLITYINRKKMLEQIKLIKKIIPLNGLKYVEYANFYKFEYFAHGDDWKKNVQSKTRKKLIKAMKKWNGRVLEFPYTKNISSSLVKKKLKR